MILLFFFSSRRRHTRCALVTGVQTCALPIFAWQHIALIVVDDEGNVLPRDGETSGRLQCRGPWIIQRYFKADAEAADGQGWFDTGDVAVLHPDGVMQITDRAKDVIKSGGEWIISIELENAAVGEPGVKEAAAVGVYPPKWDERPILLVVQKTGAGVGEGRRQEEGR